MGTPVLFETEVLLAMLNMKQFFLTDAPLSYLGPEGNSKSAERVRTGRETRRASRKDELLSATTADNYSSVYD